MLFAQSVNSNDKKERGYGNVHIIDPDYLCNHRRRIDTGYGHWNSGCTRLENLPEGEVPYSGHEINVNKKNIKLAACFDFQGNMPPAFKILERLMRQPCLLLKIPISAFRQILRCSIRNCLSSKRRSRFW